MKTTIILILCTTLMIGCAAPRTFTISKHPGQTTVPKPSMKEFNDDAWYVYWADQIDAYQNNVPMPTDDYPEAAKRGYYRAKTEYQQKYNDAVQQNYVRRSIVLPGIFVGAGLLFLLIIGGW
jgi:hypothetical protein